MFVFLTALEFYEAFLSECFLSGSYRFSAKSRCICHLPLTYKELSSSRHFSLFFNFPQGKVDALLGGLQVLRPVKTIEISFIVGSPVFLGIRLYQGQSYRVLYRQIPSPSNRGHPNSYSFSKATLTADRTSEERAFSHLSSLFSTCLSV